MTDLETAMFRSQASRFNKAEPNYYQLWAELKKEHEKVLDINEQHCETIRKLRAENASLSASYNALNTKYLALSDGKPSTPPTIAAIVKCVSTRLNVPINDILGQRREQRITRARQICCYLARHLTLWSYPAIGKYIGSRDHTTVLASVRRITALRAADTIVDQEISLIERHFNISALETRPGKLAA